MFEQSDCLPSQKLEKHRALWQSLLDFQFDSCPTAKSFANRLASENGWSDDFTNRVIDEYRRFIFLCCVSGHMVCPSEEVDAVWHLHLIHTRSYWTDLCESVLGFPLHHHPTKGGREEFRKHWEMYQRTLESYRNIFQQKPPRDIWPIAFERFDAASEIRSVNLRDHLIWRKPTWWPTTTSQPHIICASLFPIVAVGLGPFDLTGVSFLTLFICLYLMILIVSVWLRHRLRNVPITSDRELSTEEIAALNYGADGVIAVVIATMLHRAQLVSVVKTHFLGFKSVVFRAGNRRPSTKNRIAYQIYQAVEQSDKSISDLRNWVSFQLNALSNLLRNEGYLIEEGTVFTARFFPVVAFIMLLIVGMTKVWIGLERNRPVGYLATFSLTVLVTAVVMLAVNRKSLAAARALKTLKSRNLNLKYKSWDADVALCAALYGLTRLSDPVFDDLKESFRGKRIAIDETSGTSTYSSGDGGGGCGGGGGGGGCGGGCGGCGG